MTDMKTLREVALQLPGNALPAYIYDLDEFDRSVDRVRSWLPRATLLYYSLKANPHPSVVGRANERGLRLEVSSAAELVTAIDAGATGSSTLFTGPGKTDHDISEALRLGCRRFSVESILDYRRLERAASMAGIVVESLLRINPGQRFGSSIRMVGAGSHFGMSPEEVLSNEEFFGRDSAAPVVGFHFFSFSNSSSEHDIIAAAELNVSVAAEIAQARQFRIRVLDLGGGFSAPFAQDQGVADYQDLGEAISSILREAFTPAELAEMEVVFESGRALVATCGSLLATVLDKKLTNATDFIVLNAGINHLGGMSGLGRVFPLDSDVEALDEVGASRTPGSAVAVGPLCTPADVLSRHVPVSIEAGDVVCIRNVGAYGLTASLVMFLSRELPLEITTRSDEILDVSRQTVFREHVELGNFGGSASA